MTEHDRLILKQRPRRLRSDEAVRALVAEHRLTAEDLIWPLFVRAGAGMQAVASMPGVCRLDEAALLDSCEAAARNGLRAIALFPAIDDALRTDDGAEALNDKGLVPTLVRSVKRNFPDLLVITDVALDPYTSHGQDGLVDECGRVRNDATVKVLVRQALSLAQAGADIVAPSDMMDGRIGAIREALEQAGCVDTKIMSYAAKYASCFYSPFRDAVGSGARLQGDKKTYQMDPANRTEALREIELDITEGADMILIKPGMPYLDVIGQAAARCRLPVFAYQVSGEYAMLEAAAARGWLDGSAAMLEALLAFKRAGCAGVLSYHALRAAKLLRTAA